MRIDRHMQVKCSHMAVLFWYHHHTHVFVSDPTQGYGLYIDWMLGEASHI